MINKSDVARIQGVAFDAVGTLIVPQPSAAEVYRQCALRQGVVLDIPLIQARFRATCAQHDAIDRERGLRTSELREQARWRAIVAACLVEVSDVDAAFQELWTHFAEPAAWRVRSDAAASLDALSHAGYPVVIASNFDARLRTVLAGFSDLASCAASAVISSEVGCRKPHREFFQIACDRLGLPLASVAYVGDDPENDVAAARDAGMRAVLVDSHATSPSEGASILDLAGLTHILTQRAHQNPSR